MGSASNYFTGVSAIPLSEPDVRVYAATVGDGSSTVFTLSSDTIKYVMHTLVLNESTEEKVTEGWTVTYGSGTVIVTFNSAPILNSRRIVLLCSLGATTGDLSVSSGS